MSKGLRKLRKPCPMCGLTRPWLCGLAVHLPLACPVTSAGKAVDKPTIGEALSAAANNPMDVLKLRCGAHARSTGQPCRRYPTPGHHRCVMHGSGGGRPQTHGHDSLAAQRERHWLHVLKTVLSANHPKPKPVDAVLGADGRWRPVECTYDGPGDSDTDSKYQVGGEHDRI